METSKLETAVSLAAELGTKAAALEDAGDFEGRRETYGAYRDLLSTFVYDTDDWHKVARAYHNAYEA